VWFVELAPLASGDYLPSATALALGIKLPDGGDPLAHLVQAAREKDALLIFDNCEHLLEAAAATIASLLAGCPRITVLASSRQSLGLTGEQIYRVPSLTLPPSGAHEALAARDALQSGAVELFAERARALDDRFAVTDENAAIVADICRRLDGIPLAIELAAARVRLLGPRQLNQRLSERFRLLTGGNRDRLPRQQTLRALIDWSYDLLDARERALFRPLGIFVGGFTLDGAVAVGGGSDLDEFDIIDVLGSLIDKSLVLVDPDGDAQRYRLLESTRAYAREKLDAAGEGVAAALRHLRYLAAAFGAAQRAHEETGKPGGVDTLLAVEVDDVRAALDFALSAGFVTDGAALLANVETSWSTLGLIVEQASRCEQFLPLLPVGAHALRAQLLCLIAVFAASTGQIGRLLSVGAEALAQARQSGDPGILSEALRWYADGNTIAGRFDVAEDALREAETLPLSKGRWTSQLYARAHLAQKRGDMTSAAELFALQLAHHREAGSVSQVMGDLINLAEIEHACGRTARALDYAREALGPSRELGERMRLALLLSNMAGYAVAMDDHDGCITAAAEAIQEIAKRDLESPFIAVALEHVALAYALRGEVARGAILAGCAAPVLAKHGLERGFTERTTHERLTALFSERLEPNVRADYAARGAALSGRDAVALVLAGHKS
jgi:predicted ATPase